MREAQDVELELKSKKLTWAELELKALGSNQEEAQAALRILRDEYLATKRNVDELQQKLDQQVAPVPTKRINLKQGEPLSPTALVRQPALPKGVQSWTLETLGHRGNINRIAYSPNGRWLASGSSDGTLRLWDSESGQLTKILVDPNGSISDLSWSPDSKRLISVSLGNDNIVRLWDAESGKMQQSFPLGEASLRCVAWSPDGRFVASSSLDNKGDVTLTLWNIETGQPVRTLKGHTDTVNSIAWSPGGLRLATGGDDGTVKLWDPMAGQVLRTFNKSPRRDLSLAWSPDKRILAIAGRSESTADVEAIRLWDTVSGKVLSSLKLRVEEESVYRTSNLAWTPDGNTLACIINDTIRIWDIQSGRLKQFSPGAASALTWSADGTILAFGNRDGEIHFWDTVSGQLRSSRISYSCGSVNSVSFSPDGRFLATAGKLGTVCLWDARRWQSLYKLQAYGVTASSSLGDSVLAWSPSNTALAIGNDSQNALVILDPQSGTVLDVIQESQEPTSSISWSPDGSLLATGTGSTNSIVQLWNAKSGSYEALQRLDTHMGPINTIVWSPDGNNLLFAGKDTMINLWQPKTSKQLRSFGDMREVVYSLAWSPDGKTFASAGNQGIRLWNIQSARARRILKNPSVTSRGVQTFISIAWSPDGTTLASGDFDGSIQIWDPNSSQPLYSFKASCGRVTSLSWSPDGQLLVCGGSDGTARVWDIRNGYRPYAALLPLWGSIGPGIAFNPEGDYRGPPGIEEHVIYVVQTDSDQELLTPKKYANRYGWVNEPWQVGLHAPGSEKVERIYVKADAQGPYNGDSWDTAFNDLQDALNAALPNTEIWVAAGAYKPDRGTGVREASFRLRNGVSVLGGFSGTKTSGYQRDPNKHETILSGDLKGDDGPDFARNGENSYHVVTVSKTYPNTVLDGFIITGGNANGPIGYEYRDGGGIFSTADGLTLINCIFRFNSAIGHGGGMCHKSDRSNLSLTNCIFSNNRATTQRGHGWGGGVNITGAKGTIKNCTFDGNVANDGGGAYLSNTASLVLQDCAFIGNRAAKGRGGGIHGGFKKTTYSLLNCRFVGNSAHHNGGGVFNRDECNATLTNCIFVGNSAGEGGGGMSNQPGEKGPSLARLTNCTFIANSARKNIGGFFSRGENSSTLSNCILWSNTDRDSSLESAQIYCEGAVINNCCIQGWTGKLGGTGNFGDAPLFIDSDGTDNTIGTEDDNLRLKPSSPCINAGDNAAVPTDTLDLDNNEDTDETIPFDIEGKPRILNGTVDLGAYESG